MIKSKIAETDLYQPVYEHFTKLGYTVNSEVNGCDVTALIKDELLVIELKKSLNMKLILQASKRQQFADLVYVAVPKPKKSLYSKEWKDKYYLLRRLELGLIFIVLNGNHNRIEIPFHPSPFDRVRSQRLSQKKRKLILKEIKERHGDYNVGGSTRKKIITAYRENAIFIACCLKKMGQLSPKELRALGTGDKTFSILNKNFYGWFDRVDRGVYELNGNGKEAIKTYPKLTKHYMHFIRELEQLN